MAGVNIQISEQGLKRANQILHSLQADTSKVTARVVNRVMDGMRTDAVSETSQKYYVKAKDVRSSITFRKATAGNLMGEMISRCKRHNLADYQLTPKSPSKGKKTVIQGAVKKAGGLKTLKSAFLVRRGGRYFPYYRTGKGRWKISSFISPSMPQIIKNEETVKVMQEKAEERFEKRLSHEIMRLVGATA